MTGIELEGVVDKLADKLGVAVNELKPVAQEVLDQYIMRAKVCSIIWAILLAGSIICVTVITKFVLKKWDGFGEGEECLSCICLVCIAIFIIIAILMVSSNINEMVAPLPSILDL